MAAIAIRTVIITITTTKIKEKAKLKVIKLISLISNQTSRGYSDSRNDRQQQ